MRRIALIQLVLAITALIAVLGAYAFWFVAVGKESATATSLTEEIKKKTEDAARVESAREALETLAADEASIQNYLIRQEDIVAFLSNLEGAGATLGAAVEVASVGAEAQGDRSYIRLSLKISGSFDAVLRTLGSIEYGPYDSRIVNVTLDTVPGENGASGQWTATATFLLGTRPTS